MGKIFETNSNFHIKQRTSGKVQFLLFIFLVVLTKFLFWEEDYNHLQKILEKLRKSRKSCKHQRNINRTYNCLQQLPTLRLTPTQEKKQTKKHLES